MPVRPLLLVNLFWPKFGEWLTRKTGANEFFLRVVQAQKQAK
jgi:hypothetical protein